MIIFKKLKKFKKTLKIKINMMKLSKIYNN